MIKDVKSERCEGGKVGKWKLERRNPIDWKDSNRLGESVPPLVETKEGNHYCLPLAFLN